MANVIKIKRSSSTAAPTSLNEGELAVSFLSDKLYVGNSSAVIPIGGKHFPGTLTANQALVANSTSGIDKVITANLTTQEIFANGAAGTAGFVLLTGGAGGNVHWVDPSTLATAVGGSNTHIQFNDSGDLGGVADFTFDKTSSTLTVGNSTVNAAITPTTIDIGSVSVNTSALLIGNSTVNAVLTSSSLDIDGTIDSGNVTVTGFVNATSTIQVGTDVIVNTSALFVGNSTVNTVLDSTSLTTNTANIASLISVGANVAVNTSTIFVGNSTVNTTIQAGNIALQGTQLTLGSNVVLNDSTLFIGNSTVNAVLTSSTFDIDGTITSGNVTVTGFVNATSTVQVGTDVIANTSALLIGNSTVNSVLNSTSLTTNTANIASLVSVGTDVIANTSALLIGNSTVNAVLTSTTLDIGANVTANASALFIGNSTVNAVLTSTSLNIDGTIDSGNVTVTGFVNATSTVQVGANVIANTSALFVGNSTVNAILTATSLNIDGTVTAGNGSFVDMSVSGNLTVTGTLTTIDTVNLVIKDPLIKLANNNSSDVVDIGFFGVYDDGSTKYTAFFRDRSDTGKYKIYNGLTVEPGTEVDLTNGVLATLVLGSLEANTITLGSPLGVASGGTGANTFTTSGVIYGNGTNALQVTAAGTDGQVLQANSTGFPVFADLDGGTF